MFKTVKQMTAILGVLLVSSGCTYNISLFPKVEPLREKVVGGEGVDKIALIEIAGFISEELDGGIVEMPDMVSRVKEALSLAEADPHVKAVVLRINSPGGTITASDLIYHEVRRFKEKTGKKVIVSILDVGASGAYYISMAADKVMAHPTSITGSIGVIMVHINLAGLLEKVGVGTEPIKSGKNKDVGSPLKPLSPEGRQILQGIIDNMYGRFLNVIAENRKHLTRERIKALADGRVYTAKEAERLGLIDGIGYLDDAIALARSEAGVREAQVIVYHRPGSYKQNIYSQMPRGTGGTPGWGIDPRRLLRGGAPRFLYLWAPSLQ